MKKLIPLILFLFSLTTPEMVSANHGIDQCPADPTPETSEFKFYGSNTPNNTNKPHSLASNRPPTYDEDPGEDGNAGWYNGSDSNRLWVDLTCKEAPQTEGELSDTIISRILEVFTGPGNASKIFLWAIGIGAIMAFGVITYSGVIWSLSGMSEEKSHAKEWIKGAIEGLVLLIVAYVILFIINPSLVTF